MISEHNLGQWLYEKYGDAERFRRVVDRVVHGRTTPEHPMPACVQLIPTQDVSELFVALHQLDYSVNGKHGCFLDIRVFAICSLSLP